MKNLPIYECERLLTDPVSRMRADRIVSDFGVRADLKGSECLADCVILYGSNAVRGFCEIYRTVGKLRGISAKSVLRVITYALARAYGITEKLSDIVGAKIPDSDIHNSLVIAYLGKLYKYGDEPLDVEIKNDANRFSDIDDGSPRA